MDHQLIQNWLQLPAGTWPPDHYTLLGLGPGEADGARIEQQVHERMQRLRCYQLTHAELATDAMNCLARALVCLTDPEAKKAYDRELFSEGESTAETAPPLAAVDIPQIVPGPAAAPDNEPSRAGTTIFPEVAAPSPNEQTFSDWQISPPPLRQSRDLPGPVPSEATNQQTTENFVLPGLGTVETGSDPSPIPSIQTENPPPPEELRAKFSPRGLRSKAGLYYHIVRTRQLLWAWEQVGKYLGRPTRFVSRPAEATDLIHHMEVIRKLLPSELLPSATPLLGEAGQPGYLVLALGRQQMIVPMLQTLLPSQREALARDWQAGHALLRSVRQFLREELHQTRRRRGWRHALRLVGTALLDRPGIVLLLGAWAAINLAFPKFFENWWEMELRCLLALGVIKLGFWLHSFHPIRLPSTSRSERKGRSPRRRAVARRQADSSHA